MQNFEYYNPTHIVFGSGQLEKLPNLIHKQATAGKVLIAYGGGSAERTGLLDKVRKQLKDFEVVEFGGIEANPEYSTLMKAVQLCRSSEVAFILAVGGGSVIDGIKFVAGAAKYEGEPWDVLERKEGAVFNEAIPFGTILTLPATGSEVNSGAVISYSERKEKRTMGGPLFFPVFSFLDPTLLATVPERQVVNGITDAFMHVLEQYITFPSQNLLQEREAEAILSTLIEIAPVVIKNPADYEAASQLFWCASHALNGNLRCGVKTDWSTHMIGHELTALYGIDHARTLAIICPALYRLKIKEKEQSLIQYGKRVWNLGDGCTAEEAIDATEGFFRSLGIETRLSSYASEQSIEESARTIKKRFEDREWRGLGENQSVTPADAYNAVINSK